MPGPYGTNEGDIWLAPDSPIQRMLAGERGFVVLIHEMLMKDGIVQECIYTTSNAELIERAVHGHIKYTARIANEN